MPKLNRLTKIAKITLVLSTALIFFRICYTNFKADVSLEKAKDNVESLKLPEALTFADLAVSLNPMEPNYYRVRARILMTYLPHQDPSVRKKIKETILKNLETAYNLNPNNLVTIRNLIPLYYFLSAENVSADVETENVDQEFLPYTKEFYAKVKNVSPNDVGVYALLAKYEKRLNLMEEYNESVEKVGDLRPDILDWYDSFR